MSTRNHTTIRSTDYWPIRFYLVLSVHCFRFLANLFSLLSSLHVRLPVPGINRRLRILKKNKRLPNCDLRTHRLIFINQMLVYNLYKACGRFRNFIIRNSNKQTFNNSNIQQFKTSNLQNFNHSEISKRWILKSHFHIFPIPVQIIFRNLLISGCILFQKNVGK